MWKWSLSAFNTFRDLALLLAVLCAARPVSALDPERSLAQYLRDDWGPSKGFIGGSVYGFAQTPDGYLWIASDGGVIRFDGVKFEPLSIPQSATIAGATALGVATSNDGLLWLRMRGRALLGYRAGAFEDIMAARHRPQGTIFVMSSQTDGGLLLAGYSDGVLRYRQGQLVTAIPPEMMPNAVVISIVETDRGLWLGTREAGLFRFDGKTTTHIEGLAPDEKINCLLAGENGDVWIGTDRGIARWTPGGISRITMPSDMHDITVLSLLRDYTGNIWIAAGARGVIRINGSGVSSLTGWNARTMGTATALFEDREHNLWIGTSRGIHRMRDSVFATYSEFAGLPSDRVGAVHVDARGRAWFAPIDGGLYRLEGDRPRPLDVARLADDVVYALDGRDDGLWIGRQYGGLTRIQWIRGKPVATQYTEKNGLAQDSVFAVQESADGTVWAGTLSGGISRVREGVVETYTVKNGLASNAVTSITEAPDGTMWFGSPEGLTRFSNKQGRSYSTNDGLPSNNVTAVHADRDGTVWIGTAAGLAVLRHGTAIEQVAAVRDSIVGLAQDSTGALWCATTDRLIRLSGESDVRQYDAADGLVSRQSASRSRSLVADWRGRIWFATDGGLSVADPSRFSGGTPAPLQIKGVATDGTVLRAAPSLALPSGNRDVAFSYMAVSLAFPERIRYRYHLDGFDREWSAPSAEQTARFTNLAPAHYVFRVRAFDSNGQWQAPEQTLALDIRPAVWQTVWFRVSMLLIASVAAWGGYRLRMRQVARAMSVRFDERLAERTRVAREIHDTFLQTVQGSKMVADHALKDSADHARMVRAMEQLSTWLQRATEEGRAALNSLRTSTAERDNLVEALRRAIDECRAVSPAEMTLSVIGDSREMHPIVRDEVYRIGYEALRNASRHSGAKRIEVRLDYTDDFTLQISDNGRGIDDRTLQHGKPGHFGLGGMRERANRIGGHITLASSAVSGTVMTLVVPRLIALRNARPTEKHR
jgi:ligand-binding sensor domain-containing protein/signal transduction histidine kinase